MPPDKGVLRNRLQPCPLVISLYLHCFTVKEMGISQEHCNRILKARVGGWFNKEKFMRTRACTICTRTIPTVSDRYAGPWLINIGVTSVENATYIFSLHRHFLSVCCILPECIFTSFIESYTSGVFQQFMDDRNLLHTLNQKKILYHQKVNSVRGFL